MIARPDTAPATRSRSRLLVVLGVLAVALLLNAGLWLAAPGLAAVRDAWSLGPTVIRAEVVVKNASGVHAYRVDRGRITYAAHDAIVLRERDGLKVTIKVSNATLVLLNGRPTKAAYLPRRAQAEVTRQGDAPATRVTAVTG